MSWVEIKGLKEQRAKFGSDAAKMVEDAGKEARTLTAEEDTKFNKLTADYDSLGSKIEFLEKREKDAKASAVENRSNGHSVQAEKADKGAAEDEARNAYIRGTLTQEQRNTLKWAADGGIESRALAISSFGVVGDRKVAGQVVRTLKDFSGVLQAGCMVYSTSDGNPFTVVKSDDSSNVGELLAEGVTTASNVDPTVSNVVFNGYTLSSKAILVSNQLVQDSGFDIETHITTIANERIGRLLNGYTTTGTGTSQPQGFVTGATLGKTAASTTAFTYGEILDLLYSLDPAYRSSPAFGVMAHNAVIGAVRKLVDTNGRPIWLPNDGFDTIAGVKWFANNSMASAFTTGQKLIAAGDWSRYGVQEVQGARLVKLVERYADNNQVGYIVFKRMDGRMLDTTAIKYLALA
jgi:HK97 family phage major capsid protein